MMLQISNDGVVSSVDEDESVYVDKKDFEELFNRYKQLEEENEQLKKEVRYWKRVVNQHNELHMFEHCKNYKPECKDIHWNGD